MAPREIHELGLREVARIRGEMEKLIAEVKFKEGDKVEKDDLLVVLA